MCPGLLDFGIDRLARLVITDREGMRQKIRNEIPGPSYPLGRLLGREEKAEVPALELTEHAI